MEHNFIIKIMTENENETTINEVMSNRQNEEDQIPLIPEDKTFNALKRIQSLLKKESALKQLCK